MPYFFISCFPPPLHLDHPVDEAEEDPSSKRKPFFSEVSRWSSNYANHYLTGKGRYIGRITLKDVVKFDGIVFLHGALDGSRKENICYRWVHLDALYSHQVAQTMHWYCWRQIKANLKLNCNLKARYIYEALVHNTWYFAEKAGDDLCMDEFSWPYYSFGGPMVDYLQDKMFSRGEQTVILSDVDHAGKLIKAYHRLHFSFQSMGSCNLGSVNSLSTNSFFLHWKERGRGNAKRFWAIEMNHASISRANIGYKSWKYYHSAVNQAETLSIATAYDVYKELYDGTHGPNWSIEKHMDYQVFRQKLTEQMFHYDPKNKLYPVDELICENTQMSKHQWSRADRRGCCSYTTDHGLVLNYHSLGTIFESKGSGKFCFSSIKMGRHLVSFKNTKWHSVRLCYACENLCYYVFCKCKDGKFDVALCSVKNGAKDQSSVSITELTADMISAVATV
eukprot:jgi/Psemu1/3079/gm1.3079_g